MPVLSTDHDVAINRYSRLSKKKDNDKVKTETKKLFTVKCFHSVT